MSKQYVTLAKDIVRLVGGKENVTNAFHCQTRVRFSLTDEAKADQAAIEKLLASGDNRHEESTVFSQSRPA